MENKQPINLAEMSEILSSSKTLKDYIFTREGGIDYQESLNQPGGLRKANTGFRHLEEELKGLRENINKNPESSYNDRQLIDRLRERMNGYSSKKEEYYKEFLLADKELSLLKNPENNKKNIDTQVLKDDLGEEKANTYLSAYLVTHQKEIRKNINQLNVKDIDNLFDAFAVKNKTGLNSNEHYVTIDLIKQGPMNNQQFMRFIEDNAHRREQTDAYYFNPEQKGWKTFKKSDVMQMAYMRSDLEPSKNTLKQSFITEKQQQEMDSLFKEPIFKEAPEIEKPRRVNTIGYRY